MWALKGKVTLWGTKRTEQAAKAIRESQQTWQEQDIWDCSKGQHVCCSSFHCVLVVSSWEDWKQFQSNQFLSQLAQVQGCVWRILNSTYLSCWFRMTSCERGSFQLMPWVLLLSHTATGRWIPDSVTSAVHPYQPGYISRILGKLTRTLWKGIKNNSSFGGHVWFCVTFAVHRAINHHYYLISIIYILVLLLWFV